MTRPSGAAVIRVVTGLVLFVLWQWGSKVPVVGKLPLFDSFVISTPSQIAANLVKLIETRQLMVHVGYTLGATAVAIVIGVATGVLVALALFNVPLLRRVLDPFLHFFNTLPRVVIAPVLLIALGVGIAPRIVMAWSFVFFLVFFNVLYGLGRLREAHRRHIRVLGGGRAAEIASLQLPIAFAWTVRAFPQAVAYGFVGTVFQEFVGGKSGIGSVMIYGLNELNAATVMGTVVVLAALGGALVAAGNWVGRRFAPWRRELGV
jgi:NitT/TauT family transport system permease protein